MVLFFIALMLSCPNVVEFITVRFDCKYWLFADSVIQKKIDMSLWALYIRYLFFA